MILLRTAAIFTDALSQYVLIYLSIYLFVYFKALIPYLMPLRVKERGYALDKEETRQPVAACL